MGKNKNKLYTKKSRFMFFSRSKDKTPGKGASEFNKTKKKYRTLKMYIDWRKALSNFYQRKRVENKVKSLFTYDDKKWSSSEAAFQAIKFKDSFPSYYEKYVYY